MRMNKRLMPLAAALCLCVALFPTPVMAFAEETEETTSVVEDTAQEDAVPEETATPETSDTEPLTPDGNLTLVDDYSMENADGSGKQFITVVTKAGNYFYLIIDRDDEGEQTVHFLNQVDEADLLALMDEDAAATYTEQTATPEPTEEPTADTASDETDADTTEKPEAKETNYAPALAVVLLLVGGCGVFLYKKLVLDKKKQEEEKPDPDADYVDDADDFEVPPDVDEEDESTAFDAEDNEPV